MSDQGPVAAGPTGASLPPATDSRLLAHHPEVRRVVAVLDEQAAAGRVVALGSPAHTSVQAAEQLGVVLGAVARCLLLDARPWAGPSRALLVVVSGQHEIDPVKLCEVLDLAGVRPMDDTSVLRATGLTPDALAPVGMKGPVDTVVDVALSRFTEVWVWAGHPRVLFPTTYDELLRITAGHAAEVA